MRRITPPLTGALCQGSRRGLQRDRKPRPSAEVWPEAGRRILALLDEKPPRLRQLDGGVDRPHARRRARAIYWRFLRAQKIDLSGRKSWCESDDPDFVAKAAEIVGLYMAPPENAIVLAIDEKPSTQGYLRLPNGRSLTGQSHDDKRHGTTTLFAASPLPSPAGVASRGPKGRFARRRHRQGHRPSFQAPPPGRVPRFHERGHSRQSRQGDPCDPRQSLHS
jgi:hypothetical protein